jgi:hypothetical protein
MKFKSVTLNLREVTTVKIRNDLTLKVGSLRMGIERDFQRIWSKPTPPVKEITRVGQPSIRDVNHDDPAYVKAFEDWMYHKTIYYFYVATAGLDPDLSYENDCNSIDSIQAFASELKAAGINDFDIGKVVRGSTLISTVSDDDVEDAKKSF